MRLRLKALAARRREEAGAGRRRDARARSLALLGDAARTREQTDMVDQLRRRDRRARCSAEGSAERAALVAAFDAALKRLEADTTLSRADRMQALIARVDLARIDVVEPTPASRARSRRRRRAAGRAARRRARRRRRAPTARSPTATSARRSITAAAYLLERAGLGAESDALLKANLAKSHSPYYLMSELASNAKKRGDKAEALRWYREAFEKSEGPGDAAAMGRELRRRAGRPRAAPTRRRSRRRRAQLWSEAAAQPDAFYERSAPLAAAGRRQAAGVEQGRRAPRRDGAAAGQARRAVRRADAQRERALDLPGAARRRRPSRARERRRAAPSAPSRDAARAAAVSALLADRAPDGALRRDRRSSTTSR